MMIDVPSFSHYLIKRDVITLRSCIDG